MKNIIAVIAALGIGAFSLGPAFAGEGNGEPFDNNAAVLPTRTANLFPARSYAGPDVGSNSYPHVAGRPGANLTALDNEVLPANGSQGPVQTANSLPRGFEEGTVAYAQARSVHNWMMAHSGAAASRVAGR